MKVFKLLTFALALLTGVSAMGQNVTAKLLDESTGDPIGFATVSITKEGQEKPTKYVLSADDGKVTIESIRKGNYTVKVELLGYKPYSKAIVMEGKSIDLGEIKLAVDNEQLDAATVSAVGNSVIIKKDTIEYNATAFNTTENDVLLDLLKKLPGIEVGTDGSISSNGQTISKITVDGKTFFLNDPQVATQNIPAKLVQKLKVIQKKSEQAEFTGIDDGREETVIDLSVQPGMMNGLIGNISAGIGKDIPSKNNTLNDIRYNGNSFLGRFSQGSQISLILNANNANNERMGRGGGNFGGGGMGMGGGRGFGGGGISTSWSAGINAGGDLFDDKMSISGNYGINGSSRDSRNSSYNEDYQQGYTVISNSNNVNISDNQGHSFGMRLDHKFSDNTSILFEPSISFGRGASTSSSRDTTYHDDLSGAAARKANDAFTDNNSTSKYFNADGFLLFRQRLGLPGRTLTVNVDFSFSNNKSDGINKNGTNTYNPDGTLANVISVFQDVNNVSNSSSINTRATYTEPLGNHFYVEANYSFNWSISESSRATYDKATGLKDYTYSNDIFNLNRRQQIGVNALYQSDTFRGQLGFSAIPTYIYNSTTKYDKTKQTYEPKVYDDTRWNFSPQASIMADPSDNFNMRFFYTGTSSQPSVQQLMPVPDNTDPLNISFGNPNLTPYFNHNMNANFRYNNRKKFSSFNLRLNGGFTQNPIVNTTWRNAYMGQYSMPFNGKTTGNAGINFTGNLPIGRSNFSLNGDFGANWNNNSSYVGENIDMSVYEKEGFYAFMDDFIEKFNNPAYFAQHIVVNTTNSLRANARLRAVYRGDNLYVDMGASTNANRTWYTIATANDLTTTFSNRADASFSWTWNATGMELRGDASYNWYNGYKTEQPSQFLVNMSITKSLFNGRMSMTLSGTDLLGQTRNINVNYNNNRYSESTSNSLGRYVILSLRYNFGTMGRRGMRSNMGGGMRGGMR